MAERPIELDNLDPGAGPSGLIADDPTEETSPMNPDPTGDDTVVPNPTDPYAATETTNLVVPESEEAGPSNVATTSTSTSQSGSSYEDERRRPGVGQRIRDFFGVKHRVTR